MKLCTLTVILYSITIALQLLAGAMIAGSGEDFLQKVSLNTGFYLEIVSLIFVMAARHYIRKDEALVRSADRLR